MYLFMVPRVLTPKRQCPLLQYGKPNISISNHKSLSLCEGPKEGTKRCPPKSCPPLCKWYQPQCLLCSCIQAIQLPLHPVILDKSFYLQPLEKWPHHAGSDELQWDMGHLAETIARLCEQAKICGYCTNHLLRATTATANNGNNGSFISQWDQELWAYQWDAWQSLTRWVSKVRSNPKDHVHTQPHRLCMHLQLQVLQTCFSSCQNITIIISGAKELWSACASMCMYIVYPFCILLSSHTYHKKHPVTNSTYIYAPAN